MPGLLLLALLAAAPAGRPPPAPSTPLAGSIPSSASASERARALLEHPAELAAPLAKAARDADAIAIQAQGEIQVEAVRRRLGVLSMLTAAARPRWQSEEVEPRLFAHLALGYAGMQVAGALFTGKAPQAAQGPSSKAWAEQLDHTIRGAQALGLGHLRSCAALSRAAKVREDLGAVCESWLREAGQGAAPAGDEKALSAHFRARSVELQGCADQWGQAHPNQDGVSLTVQLELDGLGRVREAPAQSSAGADAAAAISCVREIALSWVIAGVGEGQIELPLRLTPGR